MKKPKSVFESLKGKKALVTGASTGIGACIAEYLATFGTHVGVHYLSNKEKAEAVADRVNELSGWGKTFRGDLLDISVQQRLVDDFVDSCGGIDILINNAGGIYDYIHFSELNEKSWNKKFFLNLKAPFYLMKMAFKYMKKNGGGRIINITTVSAKYGGSPYNLHYVASKAALDTLAVGLAREGAKHNILVNSVRCGLIRTTMQDKIPRYNEEKLQERISLVPLKRAGKPEDTA